VSEENEGAEAQASALPDTAGLAIDLAMEEARSDPSLHGEVAAFLRDQRSLIDIQKHHLQQQFGPQMRQLYLGVWEKRMGVLLRIATAFTGLAIAAGIAFLIWQASQSNGLRIEPFSVPPALAARGITGEVIAGRILDQLNRMQAETNSRRASKTYASDWSQQAIRIEIPETGLSLSELDNFLRDKLGHDINVSGDVILSTEGMSLTARAGNAGDTTVSGPEAELVNIVHKAAEAIYRLTQPYRYALYVRTTRPDESLALLKSMAMTGLQEDRPWAFNAWALQVLARDGLNPALDLFKKALALQPQSPLFTSNIGHIYLMQGQFETALDYIRRAIPLANNSQKLFRPESIEPMRRSYSAINERFLGNFRQASLDAALVLKSADPGQMTPSSDFALSEVGQHDLRAARDTLAHPTLSAFMAEIEDFSMIWAQMQADSAAENWRAVLSGEATVEKILQSSPGLRTQLPTTLAPLLAIAEARLGRTDSARARIAATPDDCYPCLRARAQVAELQGQAARADYWFARAAAIGPSLPFAHNEWGQALLDRKQPDDAIARFTIANKKGPHFADPLEGWGEALMAKNQSHLALAKFAEAEKHAPNWGRLHLKWGEALVYAGKPDEAKKQFARAAQLDLTPSEKSQLNYIRGK
jgi:tetratricopeptide (TPR) repeat protein